MFGLLLSGAIWMDFRVYLECGSPPLAHRNWIFRRRATHARMAAQRPFFQAAQPPWPSFAQQILIIRVCVEEFVLHTILP
jgi:hypothetical protein